MLEMNQTLLRIIASREDISDYLFHFAKGSDAFKTLVKMTQDMKLIDVKSRGVICFTETPVTLLRRMFDIFTDYREPMYAPYGIAIKKQDLFELGARPVIYGNLGEKKVLPEEMRWRFEEYIPGTKDFTWLREWRLKAGVLNLNPENSFIITGTKSECEAIAFDDINIEFDGCVSDGQYCGTVVGNFKRNFKGISIEDIDEFNKLSKIEVDKMIQKQNLDETVNVDLGSFTL